MTAEPAPDASALAPDRPSIWRTLPQSTWVWAIAAAVVIGGCAWAGASVGGAVAGLLALLVPIFVVMLASAAIAGSIPFPVLRRDPGAGYGRRLARGVGVFVAILAGLLAVATVIALGGLALTSPHVLGEAGLASAGLVALAVAGLGLATGITGLAISTAVAGAAVAR